MIRQILGQTVFQAILVYDQNSFFQAISRRNRRKISNLVFNLEKSSNLELKKNWNLKIKKPQVSNSQENQVLELEKKDWEKKSSHGLTKKCSCLGITRIC